MKNRHTRIQTIRIIMVIMGILITGVGMHIFRLYSSIMEIGIITGITIHRDTELPELTLIHLDPVLIVPESGLTE
jgi:hypothetical protein